MMIMFMITAADDDDDGSVDDYYADDDGRMSMDPSSSPTDACQLSTRSWTITDEEGREERVEGPGVVGKSCCIHTVIHNYQTPVAFSDMTT